MRARGVARELNSASTLCSLSFAPSYAIKRRRSLCSRAPHVYLFFSDDSIYDCDVNADADSRDEAVARGSSRHCSPLRRYRWQLYNVRPTTRVPRSSLSFGTHTHQPILGNPRIKIQQFHPRTNGVDRVL